MPFLSAVLLALLACCAPHSDGGRVAAHPTTTLPSGAVCAGDVCARALWQHAELAPGQTHSVDVELTSPDGARLPTLRIAAAVLWMPAHGHGGKGDVAVRAKDAAGLWTLSSLHPTMEGPWELRLRLTRPSDSLEIALPLVARAAREPAAP